MNMSLASFHLLPAKKRLDLIIDHKTPLKLVREMSTPDLLLIIREVGAESALELVEMMHPEQIKSLFDLEVWAQNDELNPKALSHYFAVLFEANSDNAITQIYNLDIELIGVMFKMAATIYELSAGEDPVDYSELHSTSPGGRFLVCFSDSDEMKGLAQMLHTFLEQLYGRDLEFALRLLENIRFEMVSGLEEESLRFRQNRLLDLGILPRDERLEFFANISLSDVQKLSVPTISDQKNAHGEVTSPIPFALVKSDDKHNAHPFLTAALKTLSDQAKDDFWRSLVHAITNMHASLSGDFGDRDVMSETANYVKFLVEAGLMQSAHGKIDDAGSALQQYPVKILIRLGRTLITSLRKHLIKASANLNFGDDLCHVDSPLRETIKAIKLPEPRFYEGLLSAKKLTVRYFKTLPEIAATFAAINEAIFRAQFCGVDGLGIEHDDLSKLKHLSHANMLARALINAYLKKEHMLAEIGVSDLHQIFSGADLCEDFVSFANDMVSTIAKRLPNSDNSDERAHNFKNAVLIQLTQNRALLIN